MTLNFLKLQFPTEHAPEVAFLEVLETEIPTCSEIGACWRDENRLQADSAQPLKIKYGKLWKLGLFSKNKTNQPKANKQTLRMEK